jgi:hypothetical protein
MSKTHLTYCILDLNPNLYILIYVLNPPLFLNPLNPLNPYHIPYRTIKRLQRCALHNLHSKTHMRNSVSQHLHSALSSAIHTLVRRHRRILFIHKVMRIATLSLYRRLLHLLHLSCSVRRQKRLHHKHYRSQTLKYTLGGIIHTYIYTYIHTYIYAYIHTYTYTHTLIHTHIQTSIHPYIYKHYRKHSNTH